MTGTSSRQIFINYAEGVQKLPHAAVAGLTGLGYEIQTYEAPDGSRRIQLLIGIRFVTDESSKAIYEGPIDALGNKTLQILRDRVPYTTITDSMGHNYEIM